MQRIFSHVPLHRARRLVQFSFNCLPTKFLRYCFAENMKTLFVYTTGALFVALLCVFLELESSTAAQMNHTSLVYDDSDEDQLKSEHDMRRMLLQVTPLVSIFSDLRRKRSGRQTACSCRQEDGDKGVGKKKYKTATKPNRRSDRALDRRQSSNMQTQTDHKNRKTSTQVRYFYDYDYDYDDYYDERDYGRFESDYGYECGCGGGGYLSFDGDYSSIIALVGLALLFFWLIASTATKSGRKRRSGDDHIYNDLVDERNDFNIEILDALTWLSMIENIWNEETGDGCTLKALCRMNRHAALAPDSTGLAVSLSSLPLSYLLHQKHHAGFMSYIDASLLGRNLENCTTIFSTCHRVH